MFSRTNSLASSLSAFKKHFMTEIESSFIPREIYFLFEVLLKSVVKFLFCVNVQIITNFTFAF